MRIRPGNIRRVSAERSLQVLKVSPMIPGHESEFVRRLSSCSFLMDSWLVRGSNSRLGLPQ